MTNKTIEKAHELLGTSGHGKFKTPLDLAVKDNPNFNKPEHLLKVEEFLLGCWEDKTSGAVALPSRFGKTTSIHYWIAWLLLQFPFLKIGFNGYNQRISERSLRAVRRIIQNHAPELLDNEKNTQNFFQLVDGGYVLAGSSTGYGLNIYVHDDLLRDSTESLSQVTQARIKEDYEMVWSQRLEPFFLEGERCDPFEIFIGTLWSINDLLYSKHESGEVRSLKIPALDDNDESIWPNIWPTKKILDKKKNLSSFVFNAMYMSDPVARSTFFSIDWLRSVDIPRPLDWKSTVLSVDPAISKRKGADSTAVWFLILDINNRVVAAKSWKYQKSVMESAEFLTGLYNQLKPNQVLVEEVGFSASLIELLQTNGVPVRSHKPGKVDKETRIIQALEFPLESGSLVFHKDTLSDDFLYEYERFPGATHDDLLDALAFGVDNLLKNSMDHPFTETESAYAFSKFADKRGRRRPANIIDNPNNPYSSSRFVYRGDRL